MYNAKSNEDIIIHAVNNTETIYIKERIQEVQGYIDRNPVVTEDFNTFASVKTGQVGRKHK